MKFGISFAVLGMLVAALSLLLGGWYYLLLWPSAALLLVGSAYLGLGNVVFGKRQDGSLSIGRAILLSPYLLFQVTVWHCLRYTSRENAFDRLTENVYIGRRLLSSERPSDFDHVVDLTAEFAEPRGLRELGYISFPILDGHVASATELERFVSHVAGLDGTVYIHCAQGHGRTATFAVAFLIHTGKFRTVEEAVQEVRRVRPLARMNRTQRAFLESLFPTG